MSRASTQTAQDTDQERASIDATNAQLLAQQNGVGNSAASGYQNMLANPGYTQAQQAAITGATQGSLGSAFDALSQRATNRVARTNNSAGFSTRSISSRDRKVSSRPAPRRAIKLRSQTTRSSNSRKRFPD